MARFKIFIVFVVLSMFYTAASAQSLSSEAYARVKDAQVKLREATLRKRAFESQAKQAIVVVEQACRRRLVDVERTVKDAEQRVKRLKNRDKQLLDEALGDQSRVVERYKIEVADAERRMSEAKRRAAEVEMEHRTNVERADEALAQAKAAVAAAKTKK